MSRPVVILSVFALAACSPQGGGDEAGAPEAASAAVSDAQTEASADTPRRGPVEVENLSAETEAYAYQTVFDDGLSQYPGLYEHVHAMSEAAMQELATSAEQDFQNWQDSGRDWEWYPYSLEWTWEIVWSDETRVSVLQSWYVFTGGAHPNHGSGSVLWLVPEQREANLSELFADGSEGSPAMTALHEAIRAGISETKRERLGEYYDPEQEEMWLGELRPAAESFGAFTLAPSTQPERAGGLIFHFDPYAVGSYAEGSYRVLVPQSVFADHLAAEWQGVFAGEPDINPEDLEP